MRGDVEQTYRVRHLANASVALGAPRTVLGITVDYYTQFARLGDELALQPISDRALKHVLSELFPDDTQLGGRALKSRALARDSIRVLVRHGDTVGNAPGSKWAAWNAIVEHYDHGGTRFRSAEGPFLRRTEDPDGVKARALELVSAA